MSTDCKTCPLRTPASSCFAAMEAGQGIVWCSMVTACLHPGEQAHARHMDVLKTRRSSGARSEYLADVRRNHGDAVADRLKTEYHAWHTKWRAQR